MRLCDIVGRVWPERSLPGLDGRALVSVREVDSGATFVALDLMEAGPGARVLVVEGSPARALAGDKPIDAVVMAIVSADVTHSPGSSARLQG